MIDPRDLIDWDEDEDWDPPDGGLDLARTATASQAIDSTYHRTHNPTHYCSTCRIWIGRPLPTETTHFCAECADNNEEN